jgi:hypothetical protein
VSHFTERANPSSFYSTPSCTSIRGQERTPISLKATTKAWQSALESKYPLNFVVIVATRVNERHNLFDINSGRFGLWLDGDLNQGRSQPCKTFGNDPLSPDEDFWVKTLECWAFM